MKVHQWVSFPLLLGKRLVHRHLCLLPRSCAFNRGTSQPLGILPQLPITLGGKIVSQCDGSSRPFRLQFTSWAWLCLWHGSYCFNTPSRDVFLAWRHNFHCWLAFISQSKYGFQTTIFHKWSFCTNGIFPTMGQLCGNLFHAYINKRSILWCCTLCTGALELDLSFQSIVLPSNENLLEVMTSYGSWSRNMRIFLLLCQPH